MTSIHDALGRLWDANDHDRMVEYDGRWASWGAVRALVEQIDHELSDAGCGNGGRVAVVLTNRMESVAALIAIFRGGRTLVTISPLQPPERLSADLAAAAVSFVLHRPRCGPTRSSLAPSQAMTSPAGAWTRTVWSFGREGRGKPRSAIRPWPSKC